MLKENDHARQYLEAYHDGKISMGKGINVPELDKHLRYKKGQLNIINGLDNVGKTAWILWYFLQLSKLHNLTWCIWSGENSSGMLTRQLIEFYAEEKLKDISKSKMYEYETLINQYFTFIDNKKLYTNKDLYELFRDSGKTGALIDPYTGLNRKFTHEANYEFLNESRHFCNTTGITLYVNTHPHSEAARRKHTSGDFTGYIQPPGRADTEGGQPFANRVDDFITIHRYVGMPHWKFNTLIYTRKIKDTETGGEVCPIDVPIVFDWNYGKGFTSASATIQEQRNLSNIEDKEDDGMPF